MLLAEELKQEEVHSAQASSGAVFLREVFLKKNIVPVFLVFYFSGRVLETF